MIRDVRVLRAGFVPQEVEHRGAEVTHLSSVLEPIANREPADTAIVTGPSGAGKTCISQFVTERLREAVLDVEATSVNCWRNYTHFGRSIRFSMTVTPGGGLQYRSRPRTARAEGHPRPLC
mgnify:CR=1 FL=1